MSGRDLEQALPGIAQLAQSGQAPRARIDGVVVGQIVGFGEARTPLVVYPGQPGTAAVPARTILDLHGEHIGRDVVLLFDDSDPLLPIVMGCVRTESAWPLADRPAQVE